MEVDNNEHLVDLQKVWSEFCSERDEQQKINLCRSFLFKFQLHKNLDKHHEYTGFLSSVPSQLACYLLQLVYDIICTAVSCENGEGQNDIKLSENGIDHNAPLTYDTSTLILKAPSDITAIVSLREFLINGLGRIILEYLHDCDTQLITCKRELGSLLINLFPSSSWDNTDAESFQPDVPMDIKQYIHQLTLVYDHRLSVTPHNNLERSQWAKGSTYLMDVAYREDEFLKFSNRRISSDQHAFVIVDILLNLAHAEKGQNLDEKSVTLESLNFALDSICALRENKAFEPSNHEIIKFRILSLATSCLNNIFCRDKNVELAGAENILTKLLTVVSSNYLEYDNEMLKEFQISSSLLAGYILFGTLFNTMVIYNGKREDFLRSIVQIFTEDKKSSVIDYLKFLVNSSREKKSSDIKEIIDIILRTINFCRVTCKETSGRRRLRSKVRKKPAHSTEIHCKGLQVACVLDDFLLKLINRLEPRLQNVIISNFEKSGICCCIFYIENIGLLVAVPQHVEIQGHMCKFLSKRVISTLFAAHDCLQCKRTSSSPEFQKELLVLYIEKYRSIKKQHELVTFLKHILKITLNTSNKISEGILTAIVLPIFHIEMDKGINSSKNIKTILICLQIFQNCLVSSRLLTIFFNDEIINFLSKLVYVPGLVQAVCVLLSIGLNEDLCAEMEEDDKHILFTRLASIVLDANSHSSRLLDIMFVKVIRSASTCTDLPQKARKMSKIDDGSLLDLIKQDKLTVPQLLSIAVIYWRLSFDLCLRNNLFRSKFHERFPAIDSIATNNTVNDKSPIGLMKFACNILSCFLNQNKREVHLVCTENTTENSVVDAIPRNNTSLTLNEYYVVSIDDVLNDDSVHLTNIGASSCLGYRDSDDKLNSDLDCVLSTSSGTLDCRTPLSLDSNSNSIHRSFNEVADSMLDSFEKHSKFVSKLKTNDNLEIIFDIKNQMRQNGETTCNESVLLPRSEECAIDNGLSVVSSLYRLNSIWTTSVNYIFANTESRQKDDIENTLNVSSVQNCDIQFISDDKLICLKSASNCKRNLIKLLTSALGILLLDYDQKSDKNMQVLIRHLRNLLLPCSKNMWNDVENASAIIQVLHALLKVAEITGANGDEHSEKFPSKQNKNSSESSQDTHLNTSLSEATHSGISSEMDEGDPFDSDADDSDATDELTLAGTEDGYEADAEVLEISDTSLDEKEMFRRYNPSLQYRSNVVNEGLCNLVVEILMELSIRCIKKPDCWATSLTQLLKQLYAVREALGGTLFLIRGFSKVLSQNDNRLKDLQQSILDLVTDLCNPDSLSAYFNIMAAESPPIEMLLQHMANICVNTINVTPYAAIEFPVHNELPTIIVPTEATHENIKQMRNLHEIHEIDSVFTRSPCFLPISTDNVKPFSEDGFTISTWLKLHAITGNVKHQRNCEETHIISFGTQQLVISLYVNENSNLIVEFYNPTSDISNKRNTTDLKSPTITQNQMALHDINMSTGKLCKIRRRRKLETSEISTMTKTVQPNRERKSEGSALKNVLQTTTLAIFNSFSSFNILHNAPGHVLHGARIETSSIRLIENKWTHLCVSIQRQKKTLNLTVILDGTISYPFELPWNSTSSSTRKNFEMIAIGEMFPSKEEDLCEGHEYMRYSISTVLAFKRHLNSSIVANLTTMGPECKNLIYCQAGNNIPNYGFLDYSSYSNLFLQPVHEALKTLRCNLILSYSAYQPSHCTYYSHGESGPNTHGKYQEVVSYTKLSTSMIASLQNATYICGGLSCLLMMFAKTVELTSKPEVQANALNILLRVALTDIRLYTEFVKKDTLNLIGSVIKTSQCSKSILIMKVIINNACSIPVCTQKNGEVQLSDHMDLCLVYPQIIVSMIKRYSDWSNADSQDSTVLDLLLQCIQDLIHEKQLHKSYNQSQFIKAGLIKELLNLCKVYLVESPNPIYFSKTSAALFIDILNTFAGAPPLPSLLDEMTKLLLILQKPNECYVTDNRSKFYFLLTSEIPTRQRRIGLPLTTKQLRFSIRNRKKMLAVSEENFQSRGEVKINKCEHLTNKKGISPHINGLASFIYDLDTLQAISNCSGINGRKLCTVGREHHERFRKFLLDLKKRQVLQSQFQKSQLNKVSKRRPKRTRRTSGSIITDRVKKCSESAEDELNGVREFDIVNSDEISCLEGGHTSSSKGYMKLSRVDVYQSQGVMAIQDGLFCLLHDYLLILPDSAIEEVLSHYVKLEIILVLANHRSCIIRASILRLLIVLCDRLSPSEVQNASKKMYWYQLANQLALHPVDDKLIEVCIQWVTRKPNFTIGFEDLPDQELRIYNKIGLNALFAMSVQTVHNPTLAANVFEVIEWIYRKDTTNNNLMIECGVMQSMVKALQKMYLEVKSDYRKAENNVKDLLMTIAERSVRSHGQINIVWELLNILSYYGDSSFTKIVYGFRALQAYVLHTLILAFFQETVHVGHTIKFKDLQLRGSQLSNSDVRTRFDLIVDRSVQFFICMSSSYHPSAIEVQLFELLITLSISGYSRCSSLIAWGLSPNQVLSFKNCVISILLTLLEQTTSLPTFVCDWKMVKAFLWKYQSLCGINGDCSPVSKVCTKLKVTENDLWGLDECLDRLELNRNNCLTEQKPAIEKVVYKFESNAQACTDTAMSITRVVADLQNSERKNLMILMRQYDESFIYAEWKLVVQRMVHEGAPWYCSSQYPKSWELDDTEGPSRIRTRLRRCVLEIAPKFFIPEYQETYLENQPKNIPLKYLVSSHDQHINFSLNAQILFNFSAKFLPVDGEIDGELIVTDEKIFFSATHRCQFFYIHSFIDNITEIWIRRYQHQENAFEFFINTNKSFLFVVESADDRNMLREIFCDKIVNNIDPLKLMYQWREGRLTNWEYLMALNQLAGRTYNDLMQYPVFPWILADYKSNCLDLTQISSYRKLEKPIAIQYEESEQHYTNNFSYMSSSSTNLGSWQIQPYHYSSHYSNSGTVLHFLVRIPPYTNFFLRYQDNNFDIPDRTFHSLNTTWNLASKDSPTDVKELIPEFFCLPEMFENFECFNFGLRQNGEVVNHVSLPPWCSNNSRLFVLIHRQALESEMVRKKLHNWIDLIFGYKQTGQAAVDAINVFHPATYADFDFANISDPIERQAFHTMIKTYGQMPKQLFKTPHDSSTELNYSPHQPSVLTSVKGLRWGVFTGSPQLEDPKICSIYKQSNAPYTRLIPFESKNLIYGLNEKSSIMLGTDSEYSLVSWYHEDSIVRIQALNENVHSAKALLCNDPADVISCCGSHCTTNVLWFGHQSGKISVYHCTNHDAGRNNRNRPSNTGIKLSYNSAFRRISSKLPSRLEEYESLKDNKNCKYDLGTVHWSGPTILVRHTDEVTAICISMEFKIAVSIAKDGLAVIWDLNSLNYIRTIDRPSEIRHSPLNIVVISPTLGDIFTVHSIEASETEERSSQIEEECFEVTEDTLDDFVNVAMNYNGMSIMRLHSVNGKYVSHNIQEERILSACYSYIKEGVGVNVIATGFENGILKLWSSWDLSLIREIFVSQSDILSVTFSTYQHLAVLTKDYIQVWDSAGLLGDTPKFPQFMLHKGSNA